MRCARCGICCRETDMLLSEEDITRLEKQGFTREFFVRFDREGYALLRNRQGCCVFYDTQKRGCSVYAFRPSGCRVYPVIFDEENGVVVDSICHAQATISEAEKLRRGKQVLRLLEKIDAEAKSRRSK
ncbi:MAG: YkgJ family cysteine cluster protein [Candidatus Bathyarchaeota archaeon]|nr:YkgJ family cysteine cluster protein [Candidatus Bathyarchaeota archaeon]